MENIEIGVSESGSWPVSYTWLPADQVSRLVEIDRSEQVSRAYAVENGVLRQRAVQWQIPPWTADGTGHHSVSHNIAFCKEHLDHGGMLLAALSNDGVAGAGILQPEIRPGLAQLAFLGVGLAYRRQGIAKHIVTTICSRAAELGATSIYVSATHTDSAVGFYQSFGFEVTDTPIPELFDLEPVDVHMTKAIAG